MIHFTESVPIPLLILAVFILMVYPYIGAGVLLAVLCFGAGHYWLAAISFAACIGLHFVMKKRLKPVKGVVPPSRAGRRKKAAEEKQKPVSEGDRTEEDI